MFFVILKDFFILFLHMLDFFLKSFLYYFKERAKTIKNTQFSNLFVFCVAKAIQGLQANKFLHTTIPTPH